LFERADAIPEGFDYAADGVTARPHRTITLPPTAAEITLSSDEANELSTSGAVHTLITSFLGWMLDAFNFFILVFATDRRDGFLSLGRR
jgi:hypothetical protein